MTIRLSEEAFKISVFLLVNVTNIVFLTIIRAARENGLNFPIPKDLGQSRASKNNQSTGTCRGSFHI